VIFAARWNAGDAPPDIRGLLRALDAPLHFDVDGGVLCARPPGQLERQGTSCFAWQYAGRAVGDRHAGPAIELAPHRLILRAGALPQYPLYYCHWESPKGRFYLASSELTPLLRLAPSKGLDRAHIASLMASVPVKAKDAGATVYSSVRRVRPCEQVRLERQQLFSETVLPRSGPPCRDPPPVLARTLLEHVDRAVARAMGQARRVSIFAGGGLDSSGVLALALRRASGAREVEAIAQLWASPGDDRPFLELLERHLGIVAIKLPADDAGAWFTKSLCVDAQPQVFAGGCSEMLLWATARSRGAEATLTGHGGDVLLGGAVSFAAEVLRGHPLRAVRDALRLTVPWHVAPVDRVRGWVLSPLLRKFLPSRWAKRRLRRAARQPWMTRACVDLIAAGLEPAQEPRTPDDRLAQLCRLPFFEEQCVAWGQFASATGCTPVDVFRDLELASFVAQIDPDVLHHGGRHRGLYREATRGLLPETVRLRPDKAFGQPLVAQAALAAGALPWLRDLSSLCELGGMDLVDPDRLRPMFARWMQGVSRGERPETDSTDALWRWTWPLLAIEDFLRKNSRSTAVDKGTAGSWPSLGEDGTFF
jgi:asparagine synthetase B (glutamine-hydrolysing)